jgi:hypothetical protein
MGSWKALTRRFIGFIGFIEFVELIELIVDSS